MGDLRRRASLKHPPGEMGGKVRERGDAAPPLHCDAIRTGSTRPEVSVPDDTASRRPGRPFQLQHRRGPGEAPPRWPPEGDCCQFIPPAKFLGDIWGSR